MALRATMKKVGGIDMFGTRGYKVAVLGAAGGIGQVRIPSGPHTRAPVSCARAAASPKGCKSFRPFCDCPPRAATPLSFRPRRPRTNRPVPLVGRSRWPCCSS
jgi:hypothetical protein